MHDALQLSVLGKPQLIYNNHLLTADLISAKGQALLIYLAVTGRSHSRTALAGLLWGDMPEETARANLRLTLSKVRKFVPDEILQTGRLEVGLADFWLDVAEFQERLEIGDWTNLQSPISLYRGDFLEDFHLPNALAFAEWTAVTREHLRQTAVSGLSAWAATAVQNNDPANGIPLARKVLSIEPWHEEAHRYLMHLLALSGQRSAALAQYETCRRLLADELGIEPDPMTTALFEQIKSDGMPASVPLPPLTDVDEPETAVCVAREWALEQLFAQTEALQEKRGQVCFVIGEAGRGKTTLVREFARQLLQQQPEMLIAVAHNNALTGISDAYAPFREILAQLIGASQRQGRWLSGEQTGKLQKALPITLQTLVTMGPDLIGSFVNRAVFLAQVQQLADPQALWWHNLNVQAASAPPGGLAQERLIEQVTAVLKTIAVQRPLLLIIEDLHWMDASSANLFFHLCREIAHTPLCILATYRAEEVQAFMGENGRVLTTLFSEIKRLYGNVWLDLGQDVVAESFVDAYLNTQPNRYSLSFRQKLAQLTGGHALFTVELLQEMQTRGDLLPDANGLWVDGGEIDWHTLPAKVEGAIESRLQRLSDSLLGLLQLASVEGETFTAELLAQIQGVAMPDIINQLSQKLDKQHHLVTLEGVIWQNGERLTRYRFRHYLFRQYLYDSLDEAQRIFWHDAVGQTLELLYTQQDVPEIASQFAYHFREAGNLEKAAAYMLLVGQQAGRLSAAGEAIVHLESGLQLLQSLPPTAVRAAQELDFQIALGNASIIAQGYTSPAAGQAYARARDLCLQLENPPQMFPVLYGSWAYHHVRAEHKTAQELGAEWLHLAGQRGDTAALLMAHRVLGVSLLHLGQLTAARAQLEECMALYDVASHHTLGLLYGQDPGVAGLMLLAWQDWLSGQPDQAALHVSQARALAAQLDHPFSRAFMLIHEAVLAWLMGDWLTVRTCAETAVHLCRRHGFPFWLAIGQILQSWTPESENPTLGINDLLRRLSAYQQMGAALWRPFFLAVLARAYGDLEQTAVAQQYLEDAQKQMEVSGEMMWQPLLPKLVFPG